MIRRNANVAGCALALVLLAGCGTQEPEQSTTNTKEEAPKEMLADQRALVAIEKRAAEPAPLLRGAAASKAGGVMAHSRARVAEQHALHRILCRL